MSMLGTVKKPKPLPVVDISPKPTIVSNSFQTLSEKSGICVGENGDMGRTDWTIGDCIGIGKKSKSKVRRNADDSMKSYIKSSQFEKTINDIFCEFAAELVCQGRTPTSPLRMIGKSKHTNKIPTKPTTP